MTRDDLRALEAEIDLCTNVETLELILARIPKWRKRSKKKQGHGLVGYFDVLKAKVEVKIHDLNAKWSMFEVGAIPVPAEGSTTVLPKAVKKLYRVELDTLSGELVFYGEPHDG